MSAHTGTQFTQAQLREHAPMPGERDGAYAAVQAAREVEGILHMLVNMRYPEHTALDSHLESHTYSGGCRRTHIHLAHAAAVLWHVAAAADPQYTDEAKFARIDAADESHTGT